MTVFDTVIIRVVSFSQKSYEINKNNIFNFFDENQLFQLAILNASRSLYNDVKKKKAIKTTISLENYFLRAHFNPTPFGLFSSVGLLNWCNNTLINKSIDLLLSIKFDNIYLAKLIIDDCSENYSDYSYIINPSIYFIKENIIGFFKTEILNSGHSEISFVQIDIDDYLKLVISEFEKERSLNSFTKDLIQKGFSTKEIENFLLTIIDVGLIINTTLYNPINNKKINFTTSEISLISDDLIYVGNNEINNLKLNLLKEQDLQSTYFNNNPLHSIDSFEHEIGNVNKKYQSQIEKYISFINKYSTSNLPINDRLNKFTTELSNQYNDGLIRMNDVFNPHSGILYSDIVANDEVVFNEALLMKLLASDKKELYLNLPIDTESKIMSKFPATFSIVFETLKCKRSQKEIIYIKGIGGNSALKLISRFGMLTDNICNEIVNFEKNIHKNKIIAEVHCISNLRTVNISPIRHYYDYSIHVNTAHSNNTSNILLSDLYIHLENNSITLVSKKHKMQVVTRLSSSINVKLSGSEIYKFLVDLEAQNQEVNAINFNGNNHKNFFKPFISRIFLDENILLYPAQFLLTCVDKDFDEFKMYLNLKITEYDFTQKILMFDGKGEVIIDTENNLQVRKLFDRLQQEKYFYVSECLLDLYESTVQNHTGDYAHEMIASIKNADFKNEYSDYSNFSIASKIKPVVPLIDNWLYFELYCHQNSQSQILEYIGKNILAIEQDMLFFYVRYANPKIHLRIRFKVNEISSKLLIIKKISLLKETNLINQYIITPYNREVNRYGGEQKMSLAELIFDMDSRNTIRKIIKNEIDTIDLLLSGILKIKYYLQFFNFSIDEMVQFCEMGFTNFLNEFELNKALRRTFNKEFETCKTNINLKNYENFLNYKKLPLEDDQRVILSKNYKYIFLLIHMSMNRHYSDNLRFNEFKTYYIAKCYFNYLKYTTSIL